MITRLRNLFTELRSSMWFIPGLMALSGIVLSAAVIRLDATLALESAGWFQGKAPSARAMLGAIAGSMMSVTGVTFSITIVALSLASSQFGPRLLRNFMRDRRNQFVLGTFIATFVFCLLGLRAIDDRPDVTIPIITVMTGIGLAILSLGVFIFFIHHISVSIQADAVLATVAHEIEDSIDRLYPESFGEGGPAPRGDNRLEGEPREVFAARSGYVQAIAEEELLSAAIDKDLVVELIHRPGSFIVEGERVAKVWGTDLDDDILKRVRGVFIIGQKRTAEQDIEFLIDQLVETASRSLSPGINDPVTAMTCTNRLGAALSALGRREFPSPYRYDEEGRLRVIVDVSTFSGIMDAAFNQIRQYSTSSVAVTVRLLEVFAVIARATKSTPDRQDAIRAHAERVFRGCANVDLEPTDRAAIEERYHHVVAVLAENASARSGQPA